MKKITRIENFKWLSRCVLSSLLNPKALRPIKSSSRGAFDETTVRGLFKYFITRNRLPLICINISTRRHVFSDYGPDLRRNNVAIAFPTERNFRKNLSHQETRLPRSPASLSSIFLRFFQIPLPRKIIWILYGRSRRSPSFNNSLPENISIAAVTLTRFRGLESKDFQLEFPAEETTKTEENSQRK